MGAAERKRLSPEARRELLLDAAEGIFATHGYTGSGLAEIAEAAAVSKTLLYHYFPDGRPELYRAVVTRLTAAALADLHDVARAPLSPRLRLRGLVDGLLAFFETHPAAYRLVILEPWGSGDVEVVGQATAVRARLAAELSMVLAGGGAPVADTVAVATASIGTILAVCEQRVVGTLDGEQARDLAEALLVDGLSGLGLV